MAEYVEGYSAECTPGLWKRACAYQVPLYWFATWVVASMLQILVVGFGVLGHRWGYIHGIMSMVFVCGGELMAMQAVFRRDMDWDTLIILHVWRRWPRYLGRR